MPWCGRSLLLRRCLPGLRLCPLHSAWLFAWRRRRSTRLRLGARLWTRFKTRLRWRRLARFRLRPLNLRLRLWSFRLSYAFALSLLWSLALSTLRLDVLFSLLLLELLHLLARVPVATRCFSSKRGHLLFARGISRRIRLPRILIQCNLPLILEVHFLILDFLRHLLHA
jgi:hypothetical protein